MIVSETSRPAWRADVGLGLAEQRRVVSAAEAPVGGDEHEMDPRLRLDRAQQRMRLVRDLTGHASQQLGQLLGVGTRRDRCFLRAAELRRGHHLHRLGDLLRVAHRGDALANDLEARHGLRRGQSAHSAENRPLNSSSAAFSCCFSSSVSSRFSRIVR